MTKFWTTVMIMAALVIVVLFGFAMAYAAIPYMGNAVKSAADEKVITGCDVKYVYRIHVEPVKAGIPITISQGIGGISIPLVTVYTDVWGNADVKLCPQLMYHVVAPDADVDVEITTDDVASYIVVHGKTVNAQDGKPEIPGIYRWLGEKR